VYFVTKHPKVVIRLRSLRKQKLARNIISTISDAAKNQLSGDKPGIIWTHIDYTNSALFDSLAYSNSGVSLFDSIANAVFNSTRKGHVTQLVFSGAPYFAKKETGGRSTFKRVVYRARAATLAIRCFAPGPAWVRFAGPNPGCAN
jgi:hypothetical protein